MPTQTYLMRIWLPDRPGVLGAVATRLGAVKGDLLGIEVVERGGGMVIDELLIELPDSNVIDLMMREVTAVEGVRVEDLRSVDDRRDVETDAIDACAAIAEWPLMHPATVSSLAEHICHNVAAALRCSWTAIIDGSSDREQFQTAVGAAPDPRWLEAYVAGARHAVSTVDACAEADAEVLETETDTLCVQLPRSRQTLVLGRNELTFRRRDRQKANAIARVADAVSTLHQNPISPPPDWCVETTSYDRLTTPIR